MPIDNMTIGYALGSGNNLGKSRNTKETHKKFKSRFQVPHATPEKYREYKAASDKVQRDLKGSNGWMMRGPVAKGQNRNRNSILPSQIITLDIDYATQEFVDRLLAGKVLKGYYLIAHTTRSHTPENPRFRIIIFLEGEVSRERYQAASRIVAQLVDPNMEWVDKVSFRPAQMMYMPTVSKDMVKHYVYHEQGGELLDHEDIIDTWEMTNGSASDIGNLPRTHDEDELREVAEKAEDPLDKKGPVGDFCRSYSITELVEGKDGEPGIMGATYETVEYAEGVIQRMTYLGGTTSNGAVVYDDKFVYSHHGSDPSCDMLVNAYDLVRIHKFADEDKDAEKGTPVSKLPSTKKMTEFLRGDAHYRVAQAESRYDLEEMLSDDDVEYETEDRPGASDFLEGIDEDEQAEIDADIEDLIGTPVDTPWSKRKDRQMTRAKWMPKPPKRWIAKKLELTDDGLIKVTMHNVAFIVLFDPRFFRKVAFNLFSKEIVMVGDFKSKMDLISDYKCADKVNGEDWQEINDLIVRTVLDAPTGPGQPGYGLKVGKELVHDAVRLAAYRNQFHPLLEYYDDLRAKPQLGKDDLIERLFIDYYGCPDTVYYRELSRLVLIASVARLEEPGCKYDYAVIVEGAQGTGKSSSIQALYGTEYFGEIDTDLSNVQKTAEQIKGKHALELPELSAMHKSEANDAKAFMSRQQDDVRMVYDRNKSKFPRQCVIWGTTNDREYLRDVTGGRRYLIVEMTGDWIDVDGITRDRDAIWQAACGGYDQMREEQPHGAPPLFLQGEAAVEAKRLQERARKTEAWETWLETIIDWMDEEHSLQAFVATALNKSVEDTLDETYRGIALDAMVCRVAITREQAINEALGFHGNAPNGAQPAQIWQQVFNGLIDRGWTRGEGKDGRCSVGGEQKRFIMRPGITEVEKSLGFRICNPAQAPGIGHTQVDDDDPEADSLI